MEEQHASLCRTGAAISQPAAALPDNSGGVEGAPCPDFFGSSNRVGGRAGVDGTTDPPGLAGVLGTAAEAGSAGCVAGAPFLLQCEGGGLISPDSVFIAASLRGSRFRFRGAAWIGTGRFAPHLVQLAFPGTKSAPQEEQVLACCDEPLVDISFFCRFSGGSGGFALAMSMPKLAGVDGAASMRFIGADSAAFGGPIPAGVCGALIP